MVGQKKIPGSGLERGITLKIEYLRELKKRSKIRNGLSYESETR